MLRKLAIIAAASGIGAAAAAFAGTTAADNLVPGGWLQPIQLPAPPAASPQPPAAAEPDTAATPAAAPEPKHVERRPVIRSRVKARRPAAPPGAEEPPSDGKIRF